MDTLIDPATAIETTQGTPSPDPTPARALTPHATSRSPIARLPPELLIHILSFLTSPADEPPIAAAAPVHPTLERVSRAWRALLRATPTLWAHVPLTAEPAWLAAHLARSAAAPLALACADPLHVVPVADALRPHAHRVRAVACARAAAPRLFLFFLATLGAGAALERLRLDGRGREKHQDQHVADAARGGVIAGAGVGVSFVPGWFPALRELVLDGLVLGRLPPGALPRLRTLEVRGCNGRAGAARRVRAADFVDALGRCAGLRALTVVDALDALDFAAADGEEGGAEDGGGGGSTVTLAELRTLVVQDVDAAKVAALLECLVVPEAARVELALVDQSAVCVDALAQMLPRGQGAMPLLEHVRRVDVVPLPNGHGVRVDGYAVKDGRTRGGDISLTLSTSGVLACVDETLVKGLGGMFCNAKEVRLVL